MKRFSKILTLILALVTILTAFTVVALAEDEAEPKRYYFGDGSNDFTFTSSSLGSNGGFIWSSKNATTDFIQVREAYPGGNKYLWFTGNQSNENPAIYSYVSTDNDVRAQYNFSKTPIMSFDFDIMLIANSWGWASNSGNSSGFYLRPFYYTGTKWDNAGYTTFTKFNFAKIGLASTKYAWQHVTVVAEYYTEVNEETSATEQKLGFTIYVNGVQTTTATENLTTKLSSLTAEQIKTLYIPEIYITATRYYADTSSHAPYGEEFAIDNLEYAFYEEGYDVSTISSQIYNEDWEAPFGKLIATVTVGEEVSYFDNFDEAVACVNDNPGSVGVRVNDDGSTTPFAQIFPNVTVDGTVKLFADLGDAAAFAAANPGSKLTLVADITSDYFVDSVITIDARKVDAEGNYTGEVYAGIDTYARTTTGYYMKETAEGSGIYEATKGDFVVIDTVGTMTAYAAKDFVTKFNAVEAGYTVKLLSDIETSSVFKLGSNFNNVTLDLNGYDLLCISYSGNVYQAVKNEETGEFTFPTDNPTEVAAAGTLFTYNSASLNFTVTSSSPGSAIAVLNSTAETWEYDGEVVKREISNTAGRTFAEMTKDNIVLNVNNVSVYTTRLVNQGSGSPNNQSVYVTDSNIYMTSTSCYLIYSYHKKNLTLDVKDSMIYFPGGNHGYLFRWVNASSSTSYVTKVRFTNCDIIKGGEHSYGIGMTVASGVNHDMLFDNCRTYDLSASKTILGANGTLGYYATKAATGQDSVAPAAAEGYEQVDVNVTINYTIPKSMTATATEGLIQSAVIPTETTTLERTFNKLDTKAIDVNFIDTDGETVLETKQLTPGVDTLDADTYRYVKELDDDYINLLYQWADKNGNAVASGVIGLTDKGVAWPEGDCINLYAKESIDDVVKYVGGIKVAQFNIGYMSGLRYNLYLPANAPISNVSVEGFELGAATVKIGGFDYYVYSSVVGTIAAGEGAPIKVTFTYNETEYVQNWNLDVLDYATIVDMQGFEDADTANTEKLAIGNLLKFVKEALEFNSETTVDKFDEMIEYLGVSLDYGTYEQGEGGDLAQLGNVKGVSYVIYNGVASYRFYVTSADAALTFATANGENIAFTRGEGTDEEGNPEYYVTLDAMRVYDIIAPITITAGDTNVQFSMLDYIAGNSEVELTKALYDFGVAAQNYKDYIISKN